PRPATIGLDSRTLSTALVPLASSKYQLLTRPLGVPMYCDAMFVEMSDADRATFQMRTSSSLPFQLLPTEPLRPMLSGKLLPTVVRALSAPCATRVPST